MNSTTIISKQLLMNKLMLPKELVEIIKDYAFRTIKKIPRNDERYNLLLTIPDKEYDDADDVTFVYMSINTHKDYFLTYHDFEIQLQVFLYRGSLVCGIEGHSVIIK